jgi:excisionase family DNA binding protein
MKTSRHADPLSPMVGGADSSSGSVGAPHLHDEVMKVAQVAAFLGVGKNVIYTLAAQNRIPHRRVGKHLRFSRSALVRWLDSCGQQVAKEGH